MAIPMLAAGLAILRCVGPLGAVHAGELDGMMGGVGILDRPARRGRPATLVEIVR
jgi:hypothetical protein